MERFIVIVGKTILSTLDDRILFTRKDDSCSIEEWLSNTFQAHLLRQEAHHQLNISFLYTSDIKSPGYKLISVPMARKLVEISTPRGRDISELLSDLQTGLTIQLKYGLRDDRIISILEIKPEERGLKCNCICPGCGLPLVARLGKKKQWHFAHQGEACDIAAAQQTALHMLAKEIIEDSKKLLFPGVFIEKDDYTDDIEDYRVQTRIPQTIEYRKAAIVKCDSVSLEKRISNIVPDIMVTAKGRGCLIEVAVTHFVDEEKEQKIKEIGLPLFEIDLSDLYNSEF